MPKIEKRIRPRSPGSSQNFIAGTIPALIHQTFPTTNLPARAHAAVSSWIERNPECAYWFHDDDDQIDFLAENFGTDVTKAYNKLPHGAFRADLWRYCVLYKHGGVYADIDTVCQTSLKNILRNDDQFVVPNTGNVPHAVFNAFICSSAGHPILERAIDHATDKILNSKLFGGYNLVGPGALGEALNLSVSKNQSAPHYVGPQNVNGVSYRIIRKCASVKGQPRRVESEGRTVLLTKYDGYLEDLEALGMTHWAQAKVKGGRLQKALKSLKRKGNTAS